MKNTNVPSASRLSRVFASHARPNLTNASFRWLPETGMVEETAGRVGVTLLAKGTAFSVTGMLLTSNGGLRAVFAYHAPGRVEISERIPVSMNLNEPVHLELDIDPTTSDIVFWINDKGLDMGVIPGFKGGADSVRWHAGANRNRDKLNGKLTDCAIANASGWNSASFRDEHVNRDQLQDDHSFELFSPNCIAIGGSRSFV